MKIIVVFFIVGLVTFVGAAPKQTLRYPRQTEDASADAAAGEDSAADPTTEPDAGGTPTDPTGAGTPTTPSKNATVFPKIDDALLKKYTDQVCNSIPGLKGNKTSSNQTAQMPDELTEDEVYELAFLNLAYQLTSDSISHLQGDFGYKKRVLDLISIITKISCDGSVIPEMYLNAGKNLFLYYMQKRNATKAAGVMKPPAKGHFLERNENETMAKETWEEIVGLLEMCAESVEPIDVVQECDVATMIGSPDGSAAIPIILAEERVDMERAAEGHEFLDEIIDSIWWMFSTTYARCYTMFYPRQDWVVEFFDLFKYEFLNPFLTRWRNPGPFAEFFPIIFGPFDFRRARANLRACNGAAYQIEGIPERQLVRPLFVNLDGVMMQNFKIGLSDLVRK